MSRQDIKKRKLNNKTKGVLLVLCVVSVLTNFMAMLDTSYRCISEIIAILILIIASVDLMINLEN